MKSREEARHNRTVRMERVYAHSPERVWNALTDPRALAQWMLPTTFKPLPGHRFRFTRPSAEGKRQSVHCQVVEVEVPHRLAYTWQAEEDRAPTLVTWTLEAVAEGTCLRLEHIGPADTRVENPDAVINLFPDFSQAGIHGKAHGGPEPSHHRARLGRICLPTHPQTLHCVSRSNPLTGVSLDLRRKEINACAR